MDNMVEGATTKILTDAERTLIASALQSADIASFETTTQLNARDTENRDRANHTGTQAAGTITGLAAVATSGDYNDLSNTPDLSALNDVGVYADLASFPATGDTDFVYIANDTGYMYRWNGSSYTQLTDQTAIWGQISGTIANQTDYVSDQSTRSTADRARSNHTGTQTASTISDFDSSVAANAAVTANTAKVTNATHTGDATGATALTLATVNSNVGSFTRATITVNAKGLVTAAANGANTGLPEEFVVACSNETSDLTTGTAKATFRMPFAMTLTSVKASVNTAPTGSAITVNVKESGTTIFSTKVTIDASSKTSVGAATPAVLSDTSLADNAEMTIDLDTIGSVVAGKGLKVTFIGTRT